MSKVFITGVSGQDGSIVAEMLLEQDVQVVGLSRDPSRFPYPKLIESKNFCLETTDFSYASVLSLVQKHRPHYVYNFAAQPYVGKSWQIVQETIQGNCMVIGNILQSCIDIGTDTKVLNACSSEIYSDSESLLTERSAKDPVNPYGAAKLFSFSLGSAFRREYGMHVTNAIYFNHESSRRKHDFFTKKLARTIVEINKSAKGKKIPFGNLQITRDWGCAKEYMQATLQLMESKETGDFNFCSGQGVSVQEIIDYTFGKFGLDAKDHIFVDEKLIRRNEIERVVGCNQKIFQTIGWKPSRDIFSIMDELIENANKELL